MLGELFYLFRTHEKELATRQHLDFVTLTFLGDMSGKITAYSTLGSDWMTIFSFVDINDAVKKLRKEIESWQN